MNPRALKVLEFDKILGQLSRHCSFSGGKDLAQALLPSDDLQTVQEWLEQTEEAFRLLDQKTDIGFGGVSDVRHHLEKSERRSMLLAGDLLEIEGEANGGMADLLEKPQGLLEIGEEATAC